MTATRRRPRSRSRTSGDPQNPSLEAIVALHPDLVLATTSINRVETVDALEAAGNCRCTPPIRTRSAGCWIRLSTWRKHGRGANRATVLVAQLRERLDALHARLTDRPLVHVLFVVWESR